MRTDIKTIMKNLEQLHGEIYEARLLYWKKEIPQLLDQYKTLLKMVEESSKSNAQYANVYQIEHIKQIIAKLQKSLSLTESYLQEPEIKKDNPSIYFYQRFSKALHEYLDKMKDVYNGNDKEGKSAARCEHIATVILDAALNIEANGRYVMLRNFEAEMESKLQVSRNTILSWKNGTTKQPYFPINEIVEILAPLYLESENPKYQFREMITLGPATFKIKRIIETNQHDLRELAKASGIYRGTLFSWLNGNEVIEEEKILKIAKLMGMDCEKLNRFSGDDANSLWAHFGEKAPYQTHNTKERKLLREIEKINEARFQIYLTVAGGEMSPELEQKLKDSIANLQSLIKQ